MKKIIAFMLSFVIAATIPAAEANYGATDPDELATIDTSTMTEDQLREAYDELRDTYTALFNSIKSESGDADVDSDEQQSEDAIWEKRYYQDEFKNETDQPFITNTYLFKGTFSNSATTDSPLNVVVYVEKDSVGIRLREYGDHDVVGYYSDGKTYSVNILPDGGKKIPLYGTLYKGSYRIYVTNNKKYDDLDYADRFLNALKEGKEIKVSITERGGTSTYLFTIPAANDFEELYLDTFGD